MTLLTKSLYLAGLQCHKRLWWEANDRDAHELLPSVADQSRMRMGQLVGKRARALAPGGAVMPPATAGTDVRAQHTTNAMQAAPAIYEATFVADGLTASADIVQRDGDGWVLAEVKGALSQKPLHIEDIAFQAHVASLAGASIVRTDLVLLNRQYVHHGTEPLFVRKDLTAEVAAILPLVAARADAQRAVLHGDLPTVDGDVRCFGSASIDECPFVGRCWGEFGEHHVRETYFAGAKQWVPWLAEGYARVSDVPDVELQALRSKIARERQKPAVRDNRMIVVDGLTAALRRFTGPLAYLDFETIQLALPTWPGASPLAQLPVQASVIVDDGQRAPYQLDFLADGPDDCRPALAQFLVDHCSGMNGVVAYYSAFERDRLRELAVAVPRHADALLAIADNLIDLRPPIVDHVYHPDFHGSFSLKAVLPALLPGDTALDYSLLAIREGETASQKLSELMFESDGWSLEERETLRSDLLAYCRLDVFAMVRLLGRLKEIAVAN